MHSAPAASKASRSAAASSGYLPSRRRLRGCATGTPCSGAHCLTGEACSFMPRPAGRSGWVSTSTIWWPAACKAAMASRANSGVPAKTSFKRGSSALLVAQGLGQLGLDAALLERGQVFDEHLAAQVVHLVLDAHGQQAIGLDVLLFAFAVQGLDFHGAGAFNAVVDAGHRQAAFVAPHAHLAGPGDLGVDQHQGLDALFGHIDHDQALVHIDLRGGQADAFGLVHGLEHVVDGLLQARVKSLHGLGHFVQARIGVSEDGKQGHGLYFRRPAKSLPSPPLSPRMDRRVRPQKDQGEETMLTEREELGAWLRLLQTPGVGPETARKLLAAFGPPQAVWAQTSVAWKNVVGARAAQAMMTAPDDWPALFDTTWAWLH